MKIQTIAQRRLQSQSKNCCSRANGQSFRSRRLSLEMLEMRMMLTGTWTPLSNLAPNNAAANLVLLSDGSAMIPRAFFAPPDAGAQKLTPDASGSYVNGTWTALANLSMPRLYSTTIVLSDSRLLDLGGASSGIYTNSGEIYDPLANTWTSIAPFPESTFGNGPTALLPDGRVLAGSIVSPHTYIYSPTTNTWSNGPTKIDTDSSLHESWTTMADGSVLSYNVNSNRGHTQRLDPTTMTWIDSGNVPVALEAGISAYLNMGPGVLLPDGRLFQLGRSSSTAIYTPSATPGGTGTWAAGPLIPNGLEAGGSTANGNSVAAGGSSAALMPNGHVLFVADKPDSGGPTRFFDFDPTSLLATSLTDVTPPVAVYSSDSQAAITHLLLLPSGQVLLGNNMGGVGRQLYVYTPDGAPQTAWKPTITSVVANDNHYTLTGTQLNGLSAGGYYGVGTESGTNYPIVELKNGTGQVYFARTFNWSSTGVATGSLPVTTNFTLPSFLPSGTYSLTVIANGISSDPVQFVVPVAGDFNFDGQFTGADVPAMMSALADLKTFQNAYSVSDGTLLLMGDLNGDHTVNNADLQALLTKLRSTAPSNAPQMVLDINSTIAVGSSPDELLTIGNTTYFTADDGTHGRELWKTDGTAAGTMMVKDINPGKDKSNPIYLTELNGQLYFSADDGADGYELWKSDGTESGTVMVEDLFPGSYYDQDSQSFRGYSSYPGPFTKFNGELYFPADDGDSGFELWKTDGTKDGTVLVYDIAPGAFDGLPYGGVYSFLTPIGGELYFAADDGDHGSELWKTDGTKDGTVLVKDIVPGSYGSVPYNLINMNGTLFFDAYQDDTGNDELFKSDGTAAGTVLVADINPGSAGSYLYNPTPSNGVLYFVANDGTHGNELWRSDGTTAGTQLVKDILPGSGTSKPANLINLNGTLYFCASDGVSGNELWKSDGTPGDTVLVKDINPSAGDSNIKNLVNVNGTLYFSATDGTHGNELWKSDGTAAGTVLVQDINVRAVDANPANFTVLGNSLHFTADDGFHGVELWKLPLATGGGSSASSALRGEVTIAAAAISSGASGNSSVMSSAQATNIPDPRHSARWFGGELRAHLHRAAQASVPGTESVTSDGSSSVAAITTPTAKSAVIGARAVTQVALPELRIRIGVESRQPSRRHLAANLIASAASAPAQLSPSSVDRVLSAHHLRGNANHLVRHEPGNVDAFDELFASITCDETNTPN